MGQTAAIPRLAGEVEGELERDLLTLQGSRSGVAEVAGADRAPDGHEDGQGDRGRHPIAVPRGRAPLRAGGRRAHRAQGKRSYGAVCLLEVPEWSCMSTISDDERAERLDDLTQLLELIRPAVQADGGDLVLTGVDVEAGVVEVQLQGSCSSCAISSVTLQAGVERILKDRLDWVTEVIGGVDEDIDFEESAAMGRGGYTPAW